MSLLTEFPPGQWLVADRDRRIAIIRTVTVRDRKLYRAVTYAAESEGRSLIGYFPDLRMAAEVTWSTWTRHQRQNAGHPPK
ncbi:hypothetical protein D9V30_08380 [Mycetocola reblochoni]|uniref:Uncharacterized protein n=2 Tax=Mycetocola reblochoni TaxID=331618 RepID=A0A1R4JR39_9MICO|nr:hypothetical protein [Mycetocola reblochoni]RLP69313.1 hypothetical protein D9V30_08380 [Mycetocola reblochoni]SJN34245.1 hypothetical protein FM119_08865 [Mycetocola reblochoni REB411]